MSSFSVDDGMMDDPKILALTPGQQTLWMRLLCQASRAGEKGFIHAPNRRALLALLRVGTRALDRAMEQFAALNMAAWTEDGAIHVVHFTARQSRSKPAPEAVPLTPGAQSKRVERENKRLRADNESLQQQVEALQRRLNAAIAHSPFPAAFAPTVPDAAGNGAKAASFRQKNATSDATTRPENATPDTTTTLQNATNGATECGPVATCRDSVAVFGPCVASEVAFSGRNGASRVGARAEVDSEIEATDWMMDEDDDDSIPPKGENQSSSSIQSVQSESESAREAAAAPPHPPEPPAPERLSASPSEPPAERHAERPALPPPLDALYRDPENWTDAEIDAALCKAAGRDIRNPLPYVRKTLCSARAERADRQQAMTLLAAVPGGTTGAVAIPPARLPARRTLQDMQADHLAFIQQMRADGMLP